VPPDILTILTGTGVVGVVLVLLIRGDLRLGREVDAVMDRVKEITAERDMWRNLAMKGAGVASTAVNALVDGTGKEVKSG
jgi:hypothetical protein